MVSPISPGGSKGRFAFCSGSCRWLEHPLCGVGGVSCEKWVVLALVPVLGPQASLQPICACFLFCKMTWVHLLQREESTPVPNTPKG